MWKIVSGVFFGWSLGTNDSASVFGTGVSTGIVKYHTAVLLTAFLVMLGALLEGSKCMATLGELSRLLSIEAFFCTLAAAIIMAIMTYLAIPASASQAIVGAVIGAGIISGSADFGNLFKIVSCWVVAPVASLFVAYVLHRFLSYLMAKTVTSLTRRNSLYYIGIMLSGSYGAYSLGANNVANVTGVYVSTGMLSAEIAALIGGLSIASGVMTSSKKVMMTVGKGIVPLDPFSALVAVFAEAVTLHAFTQLGVPVSFSQAIVGAVVGIGLVGDVQTVSGRMLIKIVLGWVLTPVLAGGLTFVAVRLVS
jgi:PiT family inorganic phosphate transporter